MKNNVPMNLYVSDSGCATDVLDLKYMTDQPAVSRPEDERRDDADEHVHTFEHTNEYSYTDKHPYPHGISHLHTHAASLLSGKL